MTDSTTTNRQFGQYCVLGKLGVDDLTSSYRVQSPAGETLALWLLHSEIARQPQVAAQWGQAAADWARLTCPHIVPLHAHGLAPRPFLVLPLVGAALASRLAQPTLLSLQQSARLLRQICSGVEFAHQHGVVHGGLSLDTVLVNTHNDCLLSGFGLASVRAAAGLPPNSAPFLPPEGGCSTAADLYALGILAYLFITGTFPFGAATDDPHAAQAAALPAHPTRLNPALSSEMNTVLLRALAHNPDERYKSADGFAEAFARAVAGSRHTEVALHLSSAESAAAPAAPPEMSADAYYAAALAAAGSEQRLFYLRQALALDPWHAGANRALTLLEGDQTRSAGITGLPPRAAAAASRRTQTSEVPQIGPLKQVRHRRKRTVWTWIGIGGTVLLSLTSMFVLMLVTGRGGDLLNLITGNQPVSEVEGTPVEMMAAPVRAVPPSQTRPMQSDDTFSDALTDGHLHEYTFSAPRGAEVLIGVQFFSDTAQNVPQHVALFDPQGREAGGACERQRIIDDFTGIGLICRISQGGQWSLRIFGREGESTGAYAVSIVFN